MKIKETRGKVSEAHETIASDLPSAILRQLRGQLCVRRQYATLSMALCLYIIFNKVNRLIFKHNLSTGYYSLFIAFEVLERNP